MSKYIILFKYYNNNNYERLVFFNNNDKKISDLKKFINCFDNSICPCMLNVKKAQKRFSNNKSEEYKDEIELRSIPNNSYIYVEQKDNKCTCKFLSESNENLSSLSKKVLINRINYNQNKVNDNTNNFYDMIININSLIDIKYGWKIHFTENGLEKFNRLKNKKLGVIGLIGNLNKGKTFILSKLVKSEVSPETCINSEGLCFKYLEISENSNYIFLDTKGSNQPILENLEKSNDIISTNLFLQNLIILYSDILLLVVEYLSFSEQKLINTIKNTIKRGKKVKKLIIIHNLKSYIKINDVQHYIDNILLKSYSFNLRKNETVTSKKDNAFIGQFFTEPAQSNLSVFHLVFGADRTEAGYHYNNFAKYFIETKFNEIIDLKRFDIIENIKTNFSLQSKIYFEQIIKKDDFLSNEEIIKKKIFRLNKPKVLTLKSHLFEDLGLQILEENYFELKYSINKKENYLEIEIELPGNIKVDIFRPKIRGNITSITIAGNKHRDKVPKDQSNNIIDIRNYGFFNSTIIFETTDYKINPDIKNYKFENGILILRYELEKEKSNEIIGLTADEEI